jgi:hypothetical protein
VSKAVLSANIQITAFGCQACQMNSPSPDVGFAVVNTPIAPHGGIWLYNSTLNFNILS